MKKVTITLVGLLFTMAIHSQNNLRTIRTGVTFLTIAADARSAGMGDMGVATSSDVFSQQHNAAKYAFAEQSQGFAIGYTPYMTKISSDISLAQLNYYNKFNDRNAVGASLRYFGLGDIQHTNLNGESLGVFSPNEFAVDLSYSIKLTERFAGSVTGRFIHSNLMPGAERDGNANSISVDIGGYYESEIISTANGTDGRIKTGFSIQNIGPKISYTEDAASENFLPTNLRLGAGYDFIIDRYNTISLYGETTKLLVPTPPANATADDWRKYRSIGWLKGIGQSFSDAPGGISEELKEFTWALGGEYLYQDSFAFRGGYFHESQEKGSRQYATIGAGFKYNTVKIDLSYLFSMGAIQNPLENTLRFSLTFNFGNKF